MKYASFGSISHGTLRNEDLLQAFADELEYQMKRNPANPAHMSGSELASFNKRDTDNGKLIAEARDIDPDSNEACDIVNELIDALQEFAPPYAYFGSHEGDGADFGYWLHSSFAEDFDGLKVSDTSEVPADYCGEVLHVNDHGNVTLYVANNGELTEIWDVV